MVLHTLVHDLAWRRRLTRQRLDRLGSGPSDRAAVVRDKEAEHVRRPGFEVTNETRGPLVDVRACVGEHAFIFVLGTKRVGAPNRHLYAQFSDVVALGRKADAHGFVGGVIEVRGRWCVWQREHDF